MDPRIVAVLEARDIHAATCRARRAELRCSTCTDLAERASSYAARVSQIAQAA